MFDFPYDQPSLGTALFATLSYIFIYRYGKRKFIIKDGINTSICFSISILVLFGFLMAAHPINGDFFHMLENVRYTFDFNDIYNRGQEPIYFIIAEFLNRNYFLFRLLIWGVAFILILKVFRENGINNSFAIWLYLTSYSIFFVYARASAAMAIYYLGLTYLLRENNNIMKRALAVGIIALSYPFHRSMVILIALTPLCFIPINKKTFYILVCSLPFIVFVVRYAFSGLMNDLSVLDSEDLQRKLSSYSEKEAEQTTLRNLIISFFEYGSVYIPFVVSCYYFIIKENYKNSSNTIRRTFNYLFWLMIITTAVGFLDMEINTFYYRMLYMTLIPLVTIVVYLLQTKIIPTHVVKKIIVFCVCSQMIRYLYMIYLNNLNS